MKLLTFQDGIGRTFEIHDGGTTPRTSTFTVWRPDRAAIMIQRFSIPVSHDRQIQQLARSLPPHLKTGDPHPSSRSKIIERLVRLVRMGWYQVYEIVPAPTAYQPLVLDDLQPVPEAEQPANVKGLGKKQVFWAEKSNSEMPDETDDKKPVSRCPRANFNSESMKTASPEVRAWMEEQHVAVHRRDGILGADGGGGFARYQTRTGTIKKDTVIWRYFDDECNPVGAWWFSQPLAGDPRVFAALPTSSRGTFVVKGIAKRDIPILVGPGAPRCSNKPGGPEQIFMASPPRIRDAHGKELPENDYMALE